MQRANGGQLALELPLRVTKFENPTLSAKDAERMGHPPY